MTIVNLHSPDGKVHAAIQLEGIEPEQYKQLSDLLGAALEREQLAYVAVSVAMRQAVELCPKANPADLWVHLIYDQFRNRFKRADQSWKRVSGQAFEHVLASVYQTRLFAHGISLRPSRRTDAVAFGLVKRGLGSAKTDLVLEGSHAGKLHKFGVIHCKASIAERLTDDVPVSKALMRQGVWSAIATMDAQMFPPPAEPERIKHGAKTSEASIISGGSQWHSVTRVSYSHHEGRDGKPDTLRVDYRSGLRIVASEWVCLEHPQGYALAKAHAWWGKRGQMPLPQSIDEALECTEELREPYRIAVRKSGKYTEIINHEFATQALEAA